MMNLMKALLTIFALTMIVSISLDAYEDQVTHPLLTKRAISSSNLDSYLKKNLGAQFTSGVETVIESKQVIDLLTKGSTAEDSPFCRASNHFHDPFKSWDASYMTDFPAANIKCSNEGWTEHYSNITWGTGYQAPPPAGQKQTFSLPSDFMPNNWDNARTYYFAALTSKTNTDREGNFAKTFQAVGQVMHLLQDMAVPAHVRNDMWSHIRANSMATNLPFLRWFNNEYELYVKNNSVLVDNADANVINATKALFTNPKLTDFWDTNQYNGGPTTANLGLAEFTNLNYLSDNTIPTAIYSRYPYPPKADIFHYRVCSDLIPSSGEILPAVQVKKRKYLSRLSAGECPPITAARSADHFAAVTIWSAISAAIDPLPSPYISKLELYLDHNVHNTYAKELLPRAIGYSAGLLNYFFRGTLEISRPSEGVYAVTDGSQTPYTYTSSDGNTTQHQDFSIIKAKVRNTTPNEQITAGALIAVAKYRMRTDYQPDLSADPTDEHPEWGLYEADFTYSVSDPVAVSTLSSEELAHLNSTGHEFTFEFPFNNTIPAGITDLYLHVVFKGTIGNEADNAIAVGIKDLTEPAHHVFWNLTDMFSLLSTKGTDTVARWHLYTEGDIMSDTSVGGLASKVDLNHNGIFNEPNEPDIRPDQINFDIAYVNEADPATPPQPLARISNLPAGRYIRLIIIQDMTQPRFMHLSFTSTNDPEVSAGTEDFSRVINEQESDGIFYYTSVESFRHDFSDLPIKDHVSFGIVSCSPAATDLATGDTYCPYDETEAIATDQEPYGPVEILFNNP